MNSQYYAREVCCKPCNRKDVRFFTQFTCEENIVIPKQKPDVEEVISTIVEPEIISVRVINTPKGTSYEGQHLTGKKVSLEIKIKQKIMYISTHENQSVHVTENEWLASVFVVVPKTIAGASIEELIKNNLLKPNIIVENVSTIKKDKRSLLKTVMLFMDLRLNLNYMICYSENYNCYKSKISIAYDCMVKNKEILELKNYKMFNPMWSTCGHKFAFITYNKSKSILCVSNDRNFAVKEVTDPNQFKFISSFCWADSNTILFTTYINNFKEIISININTGKWMQLTRSFNSINNFKPKTSLEGNKIGYLRSNCDQVNLYVMNKNGLGIKPLTKASKVKDFCWMSNLTIAYICSKEFKIDKEKIEDYTLECKNNGDEICIIDTINCYTEVLNISHLNLNMKNIKCSPDNMLISFIGENSHTQDIYIYDLSKNKFSNITNNDCGIEISDYDWKYDSVTIYFASNQECYYNIYCINIFEKCKEQLSNSNANEIKLNYKNKII